LVLSIEFECLDHFVCFGESHLRHIVNEYIAHNNQACPHQGVGNRPLAEVKDDDPPSTLPFPADAIVCEERLGGLLKHYRRAA
jgi:hypothetical protein